MAREISGTEALSALFAEPNAGRERRRAGRGFAIAGWIIGVLVVLLVVAYLLADNWLRSTAETVAETALAQALPENTVTGAMTVHINGPSFLLQYVSGSFDNVEVDARSLTLGGITAPAHIVATGVPTSTDQKVGSVTIQFALDAKSLTMLLGDRGTVTALGEGTVTINQSATVNGVPFSAQAVGAPRLASGAFSLAVGQVTVTQAPEGVDPNALAQGLQSQPTASICVADKLPRALPARSITVTTKAANITLAGENVAVSRKLFSAKGTC